MCFIVLVEIWRQTVTAGGDVVLISSYSDASKSHTKLDFIQDLLLRSSSSHLRYVVPGTQCSKSYCKEKIRKVMEQCDKSGGECLIICDFLIILLHDVIISFSCHHVQW